MDNVISSIPFSQFESQMLYLNMEKQLMSLNIFMLLNIYKTRAHTKKVHIMSFDECKTEYITKSNVVHGHQDKLENQPTSGRKKFRIP